MALKVSNLDGNELADDYIRTYNPQSRWGDTWGIVKNSFLKLVLINLFVLICFVPAITIVILRNVSAFLLNRSSDLFTLLTKAYYILFIPTRWGLPKSCILLPICIFTRGFSLQGWLLP